MSFKVPSNSNQSVVPWSSILFNLKKRGVFLWFLPCCYFSEQLEAVHTYIIITFHPDHIHFGFRSHWWNGSALRHPLGFRSRTELFRTQGKSSICKHHESNNAANKYFPAAPQSFISQPGTTSASYWAGAALLELLTAIWVTKLLVFNRN